MLDAFQFSCCIAGRLVQKAGWEGEGMKEGARSVLKIPPAPDTSADVLAACGAEGVVGRDKKGVRLAGRLMQKAGWEGACREERARSVLKMPPAPGISADILAAGGTEEVAGRDKEGARVAQADATARADEAKEGLNEGE